ncbi:hypothetical protein BWQ93_05935 [Sphingopyxis sp. QXT-31]|uniref:hypothetical protein n=1 Tax=Sphingopyxis sp. QXT-31 TaxID=1357916 RepID=UPI0009793E8B|nr:hypothetical protein [Sphingopyxis sp. QXT-31]APZ98070.1 hypothetical protein BWQ93_05935 [Sphingopyxis sp. QXT-31]
MTNAVFDISTEAVVDTATLHVKNAAGEHLYADTDRKLPVQIEVWGPGSDAYGVVEARQTARAVKRIQENEGKLPTPNYEDTLRESAEDLATLTRRFVNFAYPAAGDATGPELFAAVYRDPKLGFIAKQVQAAVKDWGKFKAASATG